MTAALPARPAFVAALTALLLVGCSPGDGDGASPTDRPSVEESSDASGTLGDELELVDVLAVDVEYDEPRSLALGDGFVSFGARDGNDPVVVIVDLETGADRVVYRSDWSEGVVDWVTANGDWVVFSVLDRVPDANYPVSIWEMSALNVRTDEVRVLTSSGGQEAPWQLAPEAGGGLVVWREPEDPTDEDGGIRVRAWELGGKQVRDLDFVHSKSTALMTNGATISYILYDLRNRRKDGFWPADVWVADVASGERHRVSTSGNVQWIALGHEDVVWSEREPSKEFDDPFYHYSAPIAGDEPLRIQRGWSDSNVVAGDDFAAWWGNRAGDIVVSSFDGEHQTRFRRGPYVVPLRLDAEGDLLAFGAQDKGTTLHVVRVQQP